ncbi:TonB-dependent receptor [Nitrosomonas sp.]|uniref:TonB-dependent receptor domain-containing protein n=1 Tax=Nitrosomonas sp. TaxID=42353 RepID=UPI0025DECB0F|nr:TonB-dependent receptor [Nitrosomonas sp.]
MFVLTAALFSLSPIGSLHAAAVCTAETARARIVSVQGVIEIKRMQKKTWQSAVMDTLLCEGDMIRSRSHSRAALRLNNDSMLRLDQKSSIIFPTIQEDKNISLLDFIEGAIHIITRTPKPFKIRTPFVNASVDGTEFLVSVHGNDAEVVVYEGKVSVSNDWGHLVLNDYEAATIHRGQAPQKEITLFPIDAVQWTLYYPTILDYWQDRGVQDINALIHQAGQLLSTGQVEEAQEIIQRVLQLEPVNSDAYALQAIIAVVQNDKDQALELATTAVANNPESAVAHLALSYVQQAHFEIEVALKSVQQAMLLDPQQALAWARIAELQMSLGELEQAQQAAQQAVELNPALSKTQTILGFAQLLQLETQAAKAIFQHAIELDQADPMPRLGLGLALIREGNLEAGRIELEIAASLDPANSLIRSYLGKAYFEEKRYPLSSTQFDLAKERDPKDPTPWLYDGIQKQTQNRPVEALRDIQKSIELNNNRAVYRSRLLLDRDEAARGSSLARIFENLGFEKRALMETAKSLSFDPSNHSAHRFLSDTYANISRHEAARVSELLQAQLLQPINVNPVQPHLVVADLNIINNTGPSNPGFNEFSPLMERSKAQLITSGVVGNNGSLGNEVVFSKFNERTSISLGQFHYETNGFRTNNDQNHDILNAFVQHALTSRLNLQAEARTRSSDQGNLLLDFDRDSTNLNLPQNRFRRKIDEDSVRIGSKYDLAPNQNIIMSGQYTDRKSENTDPIPVGLINNLTSAKNEAYQTEIQYQFRSNRINMLAGSGIYRTNVDRDIREISLLTKQVNCCSTENFSNDKTNGYVYTNLNFNENTNATLGFSYDSYKGRGLPVDGFNPKLGLQWSFTKQLRLRMALIETIKAPLTTQQTIEPTQVAGFNQLFDDPNGTKSRRMGIGLDAHHGNKVFTGFEISSRDLRVPVHSSRSSSFQDQKENLYRAYLYGLLHTNWTAKSEIQFEKFSRAETSAGPHQIDTLSIPTGVDYFNPQGFFANLTGTFVHQKIDRQGNQNEGVDKFFLVDASVGYRLPNRRGIVSLEARNLFDESFLFRNINFQTSEPVNSRFVPTRTIFARVTLNF